MFSKCLLTFRRSGFTHVLQLVNVIQTPLILLKFHVILYFFYCKQLAFVPKRLLWIPALLFCPFVAVFRLPYPSLSSLVNHDSVIRSLGLAASLVFSLWLSGLQSCDWSDELGSRAPFYARSRTRALVFVSLTRSVSRSCVCFGDALGFVRLRLFADALGFARLVSRLVLVSCFINWSSFSKKAIKQIRKEKCKD